MVVADSIITFFAGNPMKVFGTCMSSFEHVFCTLLILEPYSYYSAGTSGTFDNQRLHALRGSSTIIWDSTWSYAGNYSWSISSFACLSKIPGRLVIPNRDVWAIDGTVLVLGSTRYLVYSSWDGACASFLSFSETCESKFK